MIIIVIKEKIMNNSLKLISILIILYRYTIDWYMYACVIVIG